VNSGDSVRFLVQLSESVENTPAKTLILVRIQSV